MIMPLRLCKKRSAPRQCHSYIGTALLPASQPMTTSRVIFPAYIFGPLKELGIPTAALGTERGLAIEDGSADVSPFVRALR